MNQIQVSHVSKIYQVMYSTVKPIIIQQTSVVKANSYFMSKSLALLPDARTLDELAAALETDAVLRGRNADPLAFLRGIFTAKEATELIINASSRELNFMTGREGREGQRK